MTGWWTVWSLTDAKSVWTSAEVEVSGRSCEVGATVVPSLT